MSSLKDNIHKLVRDQLSSWNTARRNYEALKCIQSKPVGFDGFRMQVQFNPGRARSTTAPVEQTAERPCFLCAANRPSEQEAVRWKGYEILVNPYPIFDPHLTIPAAGHVPQFLTGKIGDMVELSMELPDYIITFNGARSGASAPDHFHFQAVGKETLPVWKEFPEWNRRTLLFHRHGISVWGTDHYLRPAIVIEGGAPSEIIAAAENTLKCLKTILSEPDEAQVNVLAWTDAGSTALVFFPRTGHRPRQYYAGGEEQFLASPGAIDMAGVMITVRECDYEKASAPLIIDLFSQVTPSAPEWERIKNELSLCLQKNLK